MSQEEEEEGDDDQDEYGEYIMCLYQGRFTNQMLMIITTDDIVICLVCHRSFQTDRQLIRHQMRSKHLFCSVCEASFENIQDLKQHKDHHSHWIINSFEQEEDDEVSQSESFSEIERLL